MAFKKIKFDSILDKFKQNNSIASLLQKGKSEVQPKLSKDKINSYDMDSEQMKQAELLFNNPIIQQERQKSPAQKGVMVEQEEPAIKSILKKGPVQEDLFDKKSKSVSFYEQGLPIYMVTSQKKWDEKIQNQKKGKFDQHEHKILADAVGQFLVCNQIQMDEFRQLITEQDKGKGVLKKQKFFNLLSSVLPQRSPQSCYKYILRHFNNFNRQGAWKQQQVDQLLALVDKYGRKWRLIAKEMKRTSDNVYDKYRSLGEEGLNQRVQGIWKLRQLVTLLTQIQNRSDIQFLEPKIKGVLSQQVEHDGVQEKQYTTRKYNTKLFVFHNISVIEKYIDVKMLKSINLQTIRWKKIARELPTRSPLDCRNKVIQILQVLFRNNQNLDELLVMFLERQNVREQININWKKWNNKDYTPEEARNRFMIMKKIVEGRSRKSFTEVLQQMRGKLNKHKQNKPDL